MSCRFDPFGMVSAIVRRSRQRSRGDKLHRRLTTSNPKPRALRTIYEEARYQRFITCSCTLQRRSFIHSTPLPPLPLSFAVPNDQFKIESI
ncbi:hypothetical protein HJC23_000412 [Cyclotella cryptica]|uniref:Uncharacterized protein n=1 Tax=Cyclotella cryptica TaxID=29204 RepID=A0ABD3PI61_9STRA